MEGFVMALQAQLQEKINGINSEKSPIKGFDKKTVMVEGAIKELKAYLERHSFDNKMVEVQYFKHWAPHFIKLHYYFSVLFNLELTRVTVSKENFGRYIESERKRIEIFFAENLALHFYYYSQRTNEDEFYFVRRPLSGTRDFLMGNDHFCKPSLLLGELLAYEDYRAILDQESPTVVPPEHKRRRVVKFLGTKRDIIEILSPVAELEMITIDGVPATLAQLKQLSEEAFANVNLGDVYVADNKSRTRKKSTTPFLLKLLATSNSKRDRLDP